MTDKSTGYWKSIVEPPHEHITPADYATRPVGVGSIWVCYCGVELEYTGQPDGLFVEKKA